MAEPPEFWAFILSNVLVLLMGGVLMGLSYRAFSRSGNGSFRAASLGFGVVTIGALIEMIYELGIRGSYELSGRELLALHTVEGVLIAAGMAILFYSVARY